MFKAVYIDKKELNCACVGGNSSAPLGVVSFLENAIMIVMGVVLLVSAATADTARLQESETVLVARPSLSIGERTA